MRKLALILVLLCGCGPKAADESVDAAGAGTDLTANLAAAASPGDATRLQALIDRAMPAALPNAKSAQYRNVRGGAGGSACGEVAAKPGAPFLPFVVSPDALAVVGTRPDIAWEDPDDFLADAWIRWCASPEELAKLRPRLESAARALPPGGNITAADPSLLDPSIIVDRPPPPPPDSPMPAPPAPRPKPAPPPQIDSFFNSVQHKDR
jgi:hypothetical protein